MTSNGRRVRVIVNPTAGAKVGMPTNRGGPDEVREAMARHGLGDDIVESSSEDDAVRLAKEAVAAGYDVVAAAGGDGTVGTVAEQLIGTDAALGVLPLGSLMNVARSLGIPRDLDGAAEVIAKGQVREVDIGEANGHLFYEVASVGLSAAVFADAQRVDEGEYGGALAALRSLIGFRPHRVSIQLDSGEVVQTRAFLVAIANGPYTGFGFTIAPEAKLDDGKFDIIVFRRFSKSELVRHFVSIALGRRAYNPKVSTYRSERVRIESHHPLPARADATDPGSTPIECVVRRRALRVLVPGTWRASETAALAPRALA